jgi:isocitrate dehydrogenase (NAD+)
VARQVAARYPDIQNEEMIVDAACMNLVMYPERFDVMVTTNLFGDILSISCRSGGAGHGAGRQHR